MRVLILVLLSITFAYAFRPFASSFRYVNFSLSSFLFHNFTHRVQKLALDMKLTGKVKFFDTKKGYGFITPDNGGDDIFVHQSAIYAPGFRSLGENEPVEFDIAEDERKQGKKFATNVTGPNGSYVQGSRKDEQYQ